MGRSMTSSNCELAAGFRDFNLVDWRTFNNCIHQSKVASTVP